MYHSTVFQKNDGKMWAGEDNWVEEYPDAFTIDEEDYLWDDNEEESNEFDEPYAVDDDEFELAERTEVQEIFEKNQGLKQVHAIYAMGYQCCKTVTYNREDFT